MAESPSFPLILSSAALPLALSPCSLLPGLSCVLCPASPTRVLLSLLCLPLSVCFQDLRRTRVIAISRSRKAIQINRSTSTTSTKHVGKTVSAVSIALDHRLSNSFEYCIVLFDPSEIPASWPIRIADEVQQPLRWTRQAYPTVLGSFYMLSSTLRLLALYPTISPC